MCKKEEIQQKERCVYTTHYNKFNIQGFGTSDLG